MPFSIERYNPSFAHDWDDFVARAKNGSFLFMRGYMDYHADRFEDFSLIARNEKGRIAALLPANRRGSLLQSHGGLTYGGWIAGFKNFDVIAMLAIQNAANRFLADAGITGILYKPIPYIYCKEPAEEDRYMLFRNHAVLESSQVSITVDLASDAGIDEAMRRKARKATQTGLRVESSLNLAPFWQILTDLLRDRYNVAPVHTLEEITLLRDRFPDNIRLYTVSLNGQTLAGSLLYLVGLVVHAQYIASSPDGKELNALPLLFDILIRESRLKGYRYFDFGTCNEQGGWYLNEGLARQKISFGGRAVVYNTYRISLPETTTAENNQS